MDKYNDFSKKDLINKINKLETIISTLEKEKNKNELLNFPWTGNLGTWTWDISENNVICNDLKILTLNYTKDEIPNKIGYQYFTEKIFPAHYKKVMYNMSKHLTGASPAFDVTYKIRTKDGKWKWFYDRGIITKRDKDGNPLLMSGIVFDITDELEKKLLLEEENGMLLKMIDIDNLTNIYNRKALFENLEIEIEKAHRNNTDLSVLMVDIDNFKTINDTYGHIVGDEVLLGVSEVFQNSISKLDIVGRYGGEEFILIFPNCNQEQCFLIADKIRSKIESLEFISNRRVTISGGIKQYNQGDCIDTIIDQADKAMYQAKSQGKNQILLSETKLV